MGRRQQKVKSTGITFALNDSGMGEYERAGLAGLYMSLTAAEAWAKDSLPSSVKTQAKKLKDLISWRLGEDRISLCLKWENEDKALTALVKWAWQVKDGVFFLPAIHRKREYLDNYYLRVHAHRGLLNTFFQHPRTIKKARSEKNRDNNEYEVEEFDESQTFLVSYRAIAPDAEFPQYKNAKFSRGINSNIVVYPKAAWIYPGSEPRFNNNLQKIKKENAWRGRSRLTYLMLFAPLSCHYIRLPRNWAFIVPQVPAIDTFQRYFIRCLTNHSNWPFNDAVAGMEDAILRYAVSTDLRRFIPHGEVANILIVVMGKAGYYVDQQKTRKNFLRIQINPSAYTRHAVFNRIYPVGKTIRKGREESGEENKERANRYIRLQSSRERITANILTNSPWYQELAFIPFWQRDQIDDDRKKARERGLRSLGFNLPWRKNEETGDSVSPERLWFLKLHQFERSQLMELSKEERMWDRPEEKRLLETLRFPVLWRLLNEEECAVGRGGSRSLVERWDDTVEKWHRRFLRAKTRPLFRAVIYEFLGTAQQHNRKWNEDEKQESRVGGTVFPAAKDDESFHAWFWHEVNDPHGWQRIRDLALLALVTFTDGRLATNKNK